MLTKQSRKGIFFDLLSKLFKRILPVTMFIKSVDLVFVYGSKDVVNAA